MIGFDRFATLVLAALKLQTADSGHSKRRLVAGFAP
jgi:hypothetical protein